MLPQGLFLVGRVANEHPLARAIQVFNAPHGAPCLAALCASLRRRSSRPTSRPIPRKLRTTRGDLSRANGTDKALVRRLTSVRARRYRPRSATASCERQGASRLHLVFVNTWEVTPLSAKRTVN